MMIAFSKPAFTSTLLLTLLLLFLTNTVILADDQNDASVTQLNKKPGFFRGLDVLNTQSPCGGGLNGLCVPRGGFKRLPWGTIPKVCFENATKPAADDKTYCSPYDVEVYSVTYQDCPDRPLTMCRCRNASVTIHQMLHDFGKVPVRARQHVRSVKAIWDRSCNAWNVDGHVTIKGDCAGLASVYVHEVGHTIDRVVLGGPADGRRLVSSTDEWRDVVLNDDTCVPDAYAGTEWPDNFAQTFVVAAYHYGVRNIWEAFPVSNTSDDDDNDDDDYAVKEAPLSIECMKGALTKMIQLTEGILGNEKGNRTCDGQLREENDKGMEFMCMGPEARAKGKCKDIADWDQSLVGLR